MTKFKGKQIEIMFTILPGSDLFDRDLKRENDPISLDPTSKQTHFMVEQT